MPFLLGQYRHLVEGVRWQSPDDVVAHNNPLIAQSNFRGRNNDAAAESATWKAAAGTGWSQDVDTTFRVRFLYQETGGASQNNIRAQLQYNRNNTGFVDVTTSSSVVRAVPGNFTAGSTVSDLAGFGTGTFTPGEFCNDGLADSVSPNIAASGHIEHEFSAQIIGADVNNGDTIVLRTIDSTGTAWPGTYVNPTVTVVKVAATLEQVAFRGRNDNGSETTATWKADENVGWTQATDEGFRVRFVIDETGGVGNEGNFAGRLQYNLASAGWNDVTGASAVVRATASPNVTEGGPTTRQLTGGTGTFIPGDIDESDGLTGNVGQIDFAAGQLTEIEYSCAIQSGDVTNGQTLQLRVVRDGGALLDGYTATPTVTVSEVVGGTATQARFRIRSDDAETVNADAGWAAATDADASIPPEQDFRIRFGIESSAGVTQAYRLQSRHQPSGGSFGSWSDVIIENGPLDASLQFAPTFIGPSAGLVDGAATTDLLGGTGTFVAGTGEEGGPGLTNSTASIALAAGQRTEVEFHVRIHKWSDNRFFVATGDQFQYRLVNAASGSVLTYDQTPTVTVAQGQGVLGGTWIEGPARIGPFSDGNGALYAFFEYTEVEPRLCMAKSTDGGVYWADATLVGRSDLADMEAVDVRPSAAGDILHILLQGVGSDNVYYFRYHTSSHASTPDTWDVIDELVILGPDPLEQSVSLEVRADGTIVAFYTRLDTVDHVAYKIRASGGGWGAEQVIDAGDGVAYAQVATVADSTGLIYVFYKSTAGIFYRTLSTGDVLSGRTQLVTDDFSSLSDRMPLQPPVHYLSGGDEVISLAWGTADNTTADTFRTLQIINGAPQASQQASDRTINKNQGQSRMSIGSLTADGTTLHLVYADAATMDIWHTSRPHGGSWAASTEVFDGRTAHWINARVLTHSAGNGGAKVIGLVYDNGSAGFTGYGRYDEVVLDAPSAVGTVRASWVEWEVPEAAAGGDVDGALAGVLPGLQGAVAGQVTVAGGVSGVLPAAAGAFAGTATTSAVVDGALPAITGAFAADVTAQGVVGGTLPAVAGAAAGEVTVQAALSGALPAVAGELTGQAVGGGQLDGLLPAVAGDVAATVTVSGAAAGALPAAVGDVQGAVTAAGVVAGVLPPIVGAFAAEVTAQGVLAGTLPAAAGDFTGTTLSPGTLAGVLPPVAGALIGDLTAAGVLGGELPAFQGALAGAQATSGALAGTLPAVQGDLAGSSQVGDLPAIQGDFAGQVTCHGQIAGTLPAVTGEFAGSLSYPGVLAGTLPGLEGDVAGEVTAAGVLAGELPAVEADTQAQATAAGGLAGTLPALEGDTAGDVRAAGALSGALPTLSGDMAGSVADEVAGTIGGTLPPLSGDLDGDATAAGVLVGLLPGLSGDMAGLGQPAAYGGAEIIDLSGYPTQDRFLSAAATPSPIIDLSGGPAANRFRDLHAYPTPDRFVNADAVAQRVRDLQAYPVSNHVRDLQPHPTADRFVSVAATPQRFLHLTLVREGDPMPETLKREEVEIGVYTRGDVPFPLVCRLWQRLGDGTPAPLPVHGQTPERTVTLYLKQPDGTLITRACEVVDPAVIQVSRYTDQPTSVIDQGQEGWVEIEWENGDLDQVSSDAQPYNGDLVVSNKPTGNLEFAMPVAIRPNVKEGASSDTLVAT